MQQLTVQKFENAMFGNMRGYISGVTAYLNVEDCAYGLGFTTVDKNGVEKVAWDLLNRILKKFGYGKKVKADDFVPENIFYRLAMKADNIVAEKFQAWIADEVIPTLRRTGSYTTGAIEEHKEVRQAQIQARKEATGVYEMFAAYARSQGDKRNGGRIYAKFSKLANMVARIPQGCRSLASAKQLKICAMAEKIIAETILRGIAANLHYKDIEQDVMCKGTKILQLTASQFPQLR